MTLAVAVSVVFHPGTRSSALKDAGSRTFFSFCLTTRPIASLVLTATHGDCQIGQATAAWSPGEKSLGYTLQEVLNDQRNRAVELIPRKDDKGATLADIL